MTTANIPAGKEIISALQDKSAPDFLHAHRRRQMGDFCSMWQTVMPALDINML